MVLSFLAKTQPASHQGLLLAYQRKHHLDGVSRWCFAYSLIVAQFFVLTGKSCFFHCFILTDSRATFTSSVAGSESVFASKETGVSSIPSELASVDEDKIINVSNYRMYL